ncbi:MAG TPA: universal stress protein [Bacteroidota bacterium]|nr:universal stress protein [Bacteroidota bacterium]
MKRGSGKNSSQPKEGTRGAGKREFAIHRILVPIDFSEHSKNALRYAVDFASVMHAELLLLYVVEPAIYPADFSFGQVTIPQFEKELAERGKNALEDLAGTSLKGSVQSRAIIRTGKPFIEIIDVADEEDVDLILIATHGHTGVEHILFGGTAEKVIRKAHCPVFVVR